MGQQSYDSSETNRLLERLALGDDVALGKLLDRHRPFLRRFVDLRMASSLKARLDTSDVVQDTQIEATRRIQHYLRRRPMSFRVWLRKTASEQIIMNYRRHVDAKRRSLAREVSLPARSSAALARQLIQGGPSEELRRRELAAQVRQAVHQLPDADREVLLMRNFEELTNQEVAEALAIDRATASKRYGRALLKLRKILGDRGLSGMDK